MECKYIKILILFLQPKHELIDTLWNVNSRHQESSFPMVWELIDTLWNVNSCRAECEKGIGKN